ncbi:uncharacterized protein N0V89_008399 [Didymosphaeria variabile]|uniref:Uncharacterized protein n=1 Tax=Didymosphaeria variabile TaxID=1932322 RepID=A0A9W8XFN9_9PLEO|nr:uncharacterized protein N0V89_008399 [Didymosphaeria variabile]KAJ4349781.1 hypothetical protein N0V89_008399 [Didymosphaeria variabile]
MLDLTSKMYFTVNVTLAAAAIPHPWNHDDARKYRHLTRRDPFPSGVMAATKYLESTPTETKRTLNFFGRGANLTEMTESTEEQKHDLHSHEDHFHLYSLHGHDKYLPSPYPRSQEDIDDVADDIFPWREDAELEPTDTKRLRLFSLRGAGSPEVTEEKKHHLPSQQDYLPEVDRAYRHNHDEYLEDSDSCSEAETYLVSSAASINKGLQRRCVRRKNCKEICAQSGLEGTTGCTWNYGG